MTKRCVQVPANLYISEEQLISRKNQLFFFCEFITNLFLFENLFPSSAHPDLCEIKVNLLTFGISIVQFSDIRYNMINIYGQDI